LVEKRRDGQSILASRKFLAYLVAEFTWKILAALVLFWGKDSMPGMVFGILLAIVLVAGFIEVGYLLGQSSLDKYLRVAEIVAEAGHDMTMGNMQIKANGKPKPKPEQSPPGEAPEGSTVKDSDPPGPPTGENP